VAMSMMPCGVRERARKSFSRGWVKMASKVIGFILSGQWVQVVIPVAAMGPRSLQLVRILMICQFQGRQSPFLDRGMKQRWPVTAGFCSDASWQRGPGFPGNPCHRHPSLLCFYVSNSVSVPDMVNVLKEGPPDATSR
jgi:hypothetical protein